MKTLVNVLATTILIVSASGNAFAGWAFSLSDQDTSFEVWLKTDEQITLRGYAFHFRYIPKETEPMGWDGITYTHTPVASLYEIFGQPYASGDYLIMNLNASTFGPGALLDSDILIASFPFTGAGYFDWAKDLIGFSAEVNDVIFSGEEVPTVPTPLPHSTWLLASGLLGIVAIRRKPGE